MREMNQISSTYRDDKIEAALQIPFVAFMLLQIFLNIQKFPILKKHDPCLNFLIPRNLANELE